MSDSSDPLRFTEDPNAGKLGAWLRAGEQDLPSDARLARLAERLEPTFATPAGGSATTPLTGALPKLLLGVLAIAGGALLANSLRGPRDSERAQAPAPVAVSAPRSADAANSPSAGLAAPAAPTAPTVAAPVPQSSAPETAEASVPSANANASSPARKPAQSEAALLEQARSALTRDPARALSLTQQHEARFPSGVLKQEREVIAIEALRRLGRGTAASERASSFERAFPDSAHRRAVEAARPK